MGRERKQGGRGGGGGGRGEEAKETLSANPTILQNAFAHERRALIGADGTDVRQLLVNMYYDTYQKKLHESCRLS